MLQDRLSALLGCPPRSRAEVIRGMLRRGPSEVTAYWLQLLVASGIATLGLVLGSTAVVIGAMLIAPLMAPIVSLGMGFAIGSPFLVVRSFSRIVGSVIVVVGFAAAITHSLPFHEINAEIAARTSPTALDLLTAAFCALAGVYAAMRPASDVATTAAGTSIGISLVPPLCASGFGVGTGDQQVASGAALLFLANAVAIVVVGMVGFVAAGFNQVTTSRIEEEELGPDDHARFARAVSRALARALGPRVVWLRILMPFATLALVYLPLREALDEVVWQVRVRGAVRDAIGRTPARVVESRVLVERRHVELALVLLGSAADAEATRARLAGELRLVAGVEPRVEVFALPDANAFAGLEAALHRRETAVPVAPTPGARLGEAYEQLRATVLRRWPERAAGAPVDVAVAAGAGGGLRIDIAHLGTALDAPAREILERALGDDLGLVVAVGTTALPHVAIAADDAQLDYVASVAPLVARSRAIPGLMLCVTRPEPARVLGLSLTPDRLTAALDGILRGHPRAVVAAGASWSLRFTPGACLPAAAPVQPPDAAPASP
jgi:uncharacterized hydrophobic protein (TIGR00271 family)